MERKVYKQSYTLIVLLINLLLITSAWAQAPPCYEREDLLKQLEINYKEKPVAMGLSKSGRLLEIFSSRLGTWTAVLTTPDGVSCVVDSGDGWLMENRLEGQPL